MNAILPISFFALSVFFGLLLIYPYTIYPLIAKVLARKYPAKPVANLLKPAQNFPQTDIVLCAYNEQSCIAEKVDNCLRIAKRYKNVRVHVYSDGSSDKTPDILRGYGDEINALIEHDRNGKSFGINKLLEHCHGELVVFTDANTILDEELFGNIPGHFLDEHVGCITCNLRYVNVKEGEVASVGANYWSFEENLKLTESASGSTVGADGAYFVVRRELFRPVLPHIIDDMFTSLSILCDGHRVIQVDDVSAYERATTNSGEEFRRKVRIACRCFNCHRLLWPRLSVLPQLDLFKYMSHKVVRWLGGFWLAGGTITWTLFCLSIGLPWLAVLSLGVLASIIWSHKIGLTRIDPLREMLISVIAASVGVWKSMRGERFQTWTIAATSRTAEKK